MKQVEPCNIALLEAEARSRVDKLNVARVLASLPPGLDKRDWINRIKGGRAEWHLLKVIL